MVVEGRRRRLVLIVLLALIIVLLSVRAAVDVWAGRRVNEEIQRLTQRYGAFGRYGDLRRAERAGQGQNLAIAMGAAAFLAGDVSPQDMGTALLFLEKTSAGGSPMPEHLRAFHAANREIIRLAVSGRQRPYTNWADALRDDDRMPPLLNLRMVSAALWAESRFNLEQGRWDEAAAAVSAGLALAASLRYEPADIVQVVRVGITRAQIAALRDLLVVADPQEPELAEIAAQLRVGRTHDPVAIGMIGEMKVENASLTRLESGSPSAVSDWLFNRRFNGWWVGPVMRFGRPVIRLARLRLLQEMDRVIGLQAALPVTSPRRLLMTAESQAWWLRWPRNWQAMVEYGDEGRAALRAAELAVALRRYRIATGSYPDDPNVLVPRYLDRIGVDPFTGRPIEYAKQGAGFVLRTYRPTQDRHASQRSSPVAQIPRVDWTISR